MASYLRDDLITPGDTPEDYPEQYGRHSYQTLHKEFVSTGEVQYYVQVSFAPANKGGPMFVRHWFNHLLDERLRKKMRIIT